MHAAADVPTCVWVEQLNFCTAAVKGAGGRRYIAVNAAAAACLANSDESGMQGCTHGAHPCVSRAARVPQGRPRQTRSRMRAAA